MLGPVAWRTPPTGLRSVGVGGLDCSPKGWSPAAWTSPSSPRWTRRPRPRSTACARDRTKRTATSTGGSGRRCTSRTASNAAGEFDLVHNHLDWLPLAMSRAVSRADAHDDPRLRRPPDPARLPAVDVGVRVDLGRRPGARARYVATVHHGIDLPVAGHDDRAGPVWSPSAASTRTRPPPTPSRSPGGSAGRCSSADRCRTRPTSPSGWQPHVDGDAVPTSATSAARSGSGCWARRPRCCTRWASTSRSGCPSWRPWPAARRWSAYRRGALPETVTTG